MKPSSSFLKSDWSFPGIFMPVGVWMNAVARRLMRVVIYGGSGEWTNDGLKLYIAPTRFTGTVYISGVKYTGLGTKAWVRVMNHASAVEDNDGPPPSPFPTGEEWYEVSKTSGDIHVTRFG